MPSLAKPKNAASADLRNDLLDATSRTICAQRLAVDALIELSNRDAPEFERRYIEAAARASQLDREYHEAVRRLLGLRAHQ